LELSGGLDSAAVAFLAARDLGPERVFALLMPVAGATPPEDLEDAREVGSMLGIETKFGDAAADILPIAGLYKDELRALAKSLGVPERIIEKALTAGLWPGQTDEGELGICYERHPPGDGYEDEPPGSGGGVWPREAGADGEENRGGRHKREPIPTPDL